MVNSIQSLRAFLLLTWAVSVESFSVQFASQLGNAGSLGQPAEQNSRSLLFVTSTNLFSSKQDDEEPPDETFENEEVKANVPPTTPRVVSTPSSALTGLTTGQKRLDPLVVSLTRMDSETQNAPRTNIPLWGELILDKSLIVFIPVTVFAVVGFFLSVYVAVNSQDAFVEAWSEAAQQQSVTVVDESACRGLCSNQAQDLEGLKVFMDSLRKN
jgi:hypothetical protein